MEHLLPWFHLKSVPGIGNHLYKRLINGFGSPDSVLKASPEALLKIEGVNQRLANAIGRHPLPDRVKLEIDRVKQKGVGIVTFTDKHYPPLLKEIPDPPPFLYVYGSLDSTMKHMAVVGSRNATSYGISTARQLSASLAAFKVAIVSGMAVGIDTAAHEGALAGNGKTIAVLGSGIDRIYPSENRKLFHRIAQNGAVISEFPLGTEPEAYNFPIRNRIISGLSVGTIVVEATQKSGSLITARLAAEQNREVFAVPGSVRSFKSMGTHTLIKQGAKLVENAQDILDEFPRESFPLPVQENPRKKNNQLLSLTADEKLVFNELGPYPIHIDDVVRKLSMAPGKVSGILLQLELKELVIQSPGKRFCLSDGVNC